jgi:hypothetical protein
MEKPTWSSRSHLKPELCVWKGKKPLFPTPPPLPLKASAAHSFKHWQRTWFFGLLVTHLLCVDYYHPNPFGRLDVHFIHKINIQGGWDSFGTVARVRGKLFPDLPLLFPWFSGCPSRVTEFPYWLLKILRFFPYPKAEPQVLNPVVSIPSLQTTIRQHTCIAAITVGL